MNGHQFNSGYGQPATTPANGCPPQSSSSTPTPPPAPEPQEAKK